MARPKAEFDVERVEAIKAYGPHEYVNEYLAWRRAELTAIIEAAEQQEKEHNEEEWDKTYREELARARRAFGLTSAVPPVAKPPSIPD